MDSSHLPPVLDCSDGEAWVRWASRWADWDPNPSTKEEVSKHIPSKLDQRQAEYVSTLRALLGTRLEFGTAGLRGPMGAGSARMNDLVVVQTTQGVCKHLEQTFGPTGLTKGICIGFDHRAGHGCTSESMAKHAAAVAVHAGFKVYMYTSVVATPFVPWCMEKQGCIAGIMITASHNPASDNGYKLYWANGAQIIPPHDLQIAETIMANLAPWTQYSTSALLANDLLVPLEEGGDMESSYFRSLSEMSMYRADNEVLQEAFPVAYTAMHGVGYRFIQKAFDAFGHGSASLRGAKAQLEPNPSFPTVAFPNPEEGKGALQLAIATAEEAGSTLILANDPDADRLAVAEKTPQGTWHMFTGNELGSLLGHWLWCCWRKRNPDADPKRVHVIASTVSSKFLESVARVEGFQFVETLTGFKWMGSKTAELQEAGGEVIFAFEEAIGFCCGNMVKDKDGISAAVVFTEMAKQLFRSGSSCLQHLNALYGKYGYFLSLNSYVKSHDSCLTRQIFALQRGGHSDSKTYYESLGSSDEFKITGVRDLTIGYDTRSDDGLPALPLNSGGEMITYYFADLEAQVTLRTSGTEPKIKFYSEMRSAQGDEAAQNSIRSLVHAVVTTLLDPASHGLEVRPEDRDWLL